MIVLAFSVGYACGIAMIIGLQLMMRRERP